MTARSHGEVTLLDLRSIGLTKGPTCWRTVRGTANDSERQRTSANVSEGQRTRANVSGCQQSVASTGGLPISSPGGQDRPRKSEQPAAGPLTFVVVRCRSLSFATRKPVTPNLQRQIDYSPPPSPGWLIRSIIFCVRRA